MVSLQVCIYICVYIYIVSWVICKPQSFRISIAWASLTSAVAFWNCGSIMCLGLGIRVGSTDQSHRFIMIYIYIYIAWIGCYRIIDIWNSGTSIFWYDPISEYVGWFWSSANEGAQHDQSEEKHWEVMISWHFFVLTQSYSVSPGADGQDSGWLVPRSMLHFFSKRKVFWPIPPCINSLRTGIGPKGSIWPWPSVT